MMSHLAIYIFGIILLQTGGSGAKYHDCLCILYPEARFALAELSGSPLLGS